MYKTHIVISDGVKISERLVSKEFPEVERAENHVWITTKEYSVYVNADHFVYMAVENVDKNEDAPNA